MADNFLSQEEVDALLKGVNGDQDDVAAPEEVAGVRTYNLATQERIVRGRMPTLEDSIAQQAWYVGTADEVAEQIVALQDDLGVSYITIFPHFPGMVRAEAIEQIERFARDVQPKLRSAAQQVEVKV